MSVYRIEQGPAFRCRVRPSPHIASSLSDVRYVGSGKAAIALILSHLRERQILSDKMSPVIMPRWLGTWVYMQVVPLGFPTLDPSARASVLFVYHQYGFPQDMNRVLDTASERKMVVVEDCAHAAEGSFNGRPLGSFGEYALFSYSKFAFCHALGGVRANDPTFYDFANERIRNSSRMKRLLINSFKLLDEWNADRERPIAPMLFDGWRTLAYARYGDQFAPGARAVKLWETKRSAEIIGRRENYRQLRQAVDLYGICDHLESDGVIPYAVPLAINAKHAGRVVGKLRERGIQAGIYQFDINRFVFDPNFQPCVLVPIHSGMTGHGMSLLVDTLKASL